MFLRVLLILSLVWSSVTTDTALTGAGGEAGIPYELRLRMPTPDQRSEWCALMHQIWRCMTHRHGVVLEANLYPATPNLLWCHSCPSCPCRYSFNHGPIHFIQTSTEQPFGAGSPQWQCVPKPPWFRALLLITLSQGLLKAWPSAICIHGWGVGMQPSTRCSHWQVHDWLDRWSRAWRGAGLW